MNDIDTVTVPLSKPIKHKEKTYTELTFREATAGDLAVADVANGNMSRTLVILACMADVELPIVKLIRARDLAVVMEKVAPLMGEPSGADGLTS